MAQGRALIAISLIALVTGCGGGGGGGGTVPPGPPPTESTSSNTISPSGGAVSTSIGGTTAVVTVPSGAIASSTTVSLTAYLPSDFPRVLQSLGRKPQSLPAGATPLLEVLVDDGGVPLTKPLQLGMTPVAVPAGDVVRVAGFGTAGFTDIDTVTVKGTTATEDEAKAYPGASLASKTIYAFYLIPASSAAAAPTPSVAVTQTSPTGAIPAGSTAQFSASENANGFPYLNATFTYALDNAQLGTINATTGVLTAGGIDASGNVIATDPATKGTGKGAVRVASARPAQAGDTFAFSGTLTQTLTDYQLPGTTAPVSSTQTSQVAQSITSAGLTGSYYTLTANETDTSPLVTYQTQTTSSVAYQTGSGGTVVRLHQQDTKDSNGVDYNTTYGANNGALTELPENAGTLTNDAQATYLETDPGNQSFDPSTNTFGPTTQRVTASDGTYVQTTTLDGAATVKYTQNADATGVADLSQTSGVEYDFLAPTSTYIPINVFNVAANGTKTPSGPQRQVYPWYGTSVPTFSKDTVTITPSSALDASCVSTGVTTAALVTEQLNTVDVVLGQTEARTTKSYDVTGSGTVCVVLSDTIKTYYDYSLQEGPFIQKRPTSSTPFESTTLTETLSLTSAKVASAARSTQSASLAGTPVIAALRGRFDAFALKTRQEQSRRLRASLATLRSQGGQR